MGTLRENRAAIAEMLQRMEQLPQNLASSTPANAEAVTMGIIPQELERTPTVQVWENTAVWPVADYERYERAWSAAVAALKLTVNKGFALGLSMSKGVQRARELLDKIDLALAAAALPTHLPQTEIFVAPPRRDLWPWIAGGAVALGFLGLVVAYVKAGKKGAKATAAA